MAESWESQEKEQFYAEEQFVVTHQNTNHAQRPSLHEASFIETKVMLGTAKKYNETASHQPLSFLAFIYTKSTFKSL